MDRAAVSERGYVTPNDVMGVTDADSIQNAVDLALETGLNKVVIPRYNARTGEMLWCIERPVLLKSGITVVLDQCHMRAADDVYTNFFRTANIYTENGLDTAEEYHDIHIIGMGNAVLDGGKANDLSELTQYKDGHPAVRYNTPILFFNVRYFTVENLNIIDHRYWGLCFSYCKCGRISNVRFDATGDRRNQDGLNLRNGCNNILIENLYGQTSDDMVALSAIDVPRNDRYNVAVPEWNSDIHHVTIRNISGWAIDHPLVAMRNSDGMKLYDILVENVRDTEPVHLCPKSALHKYALIRIGNNFYYHVRPSQMGETRDITIRDITARTSERAITVNASLQHSLFENIRGYDRCGAAVSIEPQWAGEPGVQIDDLTVRDVRLIPCIETRKPPVDRLVVEKTAVLEFGNQREGDYIRRLRVENVIAEQVDALALLSGETEVTFNNVQINGNAEMINKEVHTNGGYLEIPAHG